MGTRAHRINEQVTFTDGRIVVSSRGGCRRPGKRADYILRYQSNLLTSGDILISRGNKRDQVGLCIVYPETSESRTYANLFMKMQVRDGILPEFVKYWLVSPLSVRYIHMHTKGTSPSVQKVNQRALINLPFPEGVPMKEPLDWVFCLNAIFNTVEEIEHLIREQHDHLKQFPDAVLTAAFKGDL